jgi:hypothetical protein
MQALASGRWSHDSIPVDGLPSVAIVSAALVAPGLTGHGDPI